jgi:hypothetical protein
MLNPNILSPTATPAFAPSRFPTEAPSISSAPSLYMPAAYSPTLTQYNPPSVAPANTSYQGISVPSPSNQQVIPVSPSLNNNLSPAFTRSTYISTKPPTNAAGFSTNKIVQAEQVSHALYTYDSPIYKSLIGGFSKDSLVGKMSNLYYQINK